MIFANNIQPCDIRYVVEHPCNILKQISFIQRIIYVEFTVDNV